MNKNDLQMLINEANKYDRRIASEERTIAALEAEALHLATGNLLQRRPKSYTAVFNYDVGDKTAKTEKFTISSGRYFEATRLASSLTIVGQATVQDGVGTAAGQVAVFTAGYGPPSRAEGPSNRQRFFDFFWRIRDTGGDFALQDVKQPSVVLSSGHAAPTSLAVGAKIPLGATVAVDIEPILNRAQAQVGGSPIDGLENVTQYKLTIQMFGWEYA